MVRRFVAEPPGRQEPETYRQFQELQRFSQDIDQLVRDVVLDFVIPNFTFAAHGTMFNQTPILGPDIGTGWQKVTSFDTVSAAQRITFDTINDTWTYENSGVYQVSVELVLSHDESNAGRTFQLRLQDGNNTGDGISRCHREHIGQRQRKCTEGTEAFTLTDNDAGQDRNHRQDARG